MLMDSNLLQKFATVAATAVGSVTLFRKFRIRQENKDVGSSSSAFSSSTSPPRTHHVFLSYSGEEDMRRHFLSYLQKEFQRQLITTFVDNEIRRGESIGHNLIHAIRASKIAIVILSRNYASSKHSLEELVEIMNCNKEFGLTVFAIYYETDPITVKELTGEFGAVFEKTCKDRTKEETGRWRQAFEEVSTVAAGYDSRSNQWEDEVEMIDEIVTEITKRLIKAAPSRDLEGLIGMEAHIEKMKQLLCLDSADERRMVGILGPSGIGKTTIARAVYTQISDGFELSVFMKFKPIDARTIFPDVHDVKLQLEQEFLSQLISQGNMKIGGHLGSAEAFVRGKNVLIVLDGLDHIVQLDAMPKAACLGPGSRIIITTQDQNLLKAYEINHIYNVDFPPETEALQIFCVNAFVQDSPSEGFEMLASEVTRLAGRLPLGLRVIGSHFLGMSKQEWQSELPRLRVGLDGEIWNTLKFCYDDLTDEEKELFLHIACFFNDEGIDYTFEDTLRHKFFDVQSGLQVLLQKFGPMHDLLFQLGRDIVRNKSINEPGKRQFLVDDSEIYEVLTDHTGTKNLIGINWNFSSRPEEIILSDKAFETMPNLRFLRIYQVRLDLPQGLDNLPDLIILHWQYFPMKSLPLNPKFLVKLIMRDSMLEKLWEENHPLINLKIMDLSFSRNLKELPDLSTASSLLEINLSECSSLIELPSTIGNAINMEILNLSGCSSLVQLPSSIGKINNLRKLDLYGCSSLVELPSSIGNIINLRKLDLTGCSSLVEVPSSIRNISNLEIFGCPSE